MNKFAFDPFLVVPDETKQYATGLLVPLMGRSYATLCPVASIPERRWGADKFHVLAKHPHEKGCPVVVICCQKDCATEDIIISGLDGLNLAGQMSLLGSAPIIEITSLLVSGNSGMLHVGIRLHVPTVSLAGSGIAKKMGTSRGKICCD